MDKNAQMGGQTAGVRINKYLAEAGVCSRREADRQIEAGQVKIDGVVATNGDRVLPGMQVEYRGQLLKKEEEQILLVFHKPVGIVCTAEKKEKDNIIDYINYPKRIYPIGRLDKDSEGLILMTNQGDLVNKIMRSGNQHEKEYVVTVDQDITNPFLDHLRNGVYLEELEVTTRRCKVKKLSDRTFSIILTQGLNRQIRRMCEACGYEVVRLKRERIMNIRLGDLKVGKYRTATLLEYEELKKLLQNSNSGPVMAADQELTVKKPKRGVGKYTNTNASKNQKRGNAKDGKTNKNRRARKNPE